MLRDFICKLEGTVFGLSIAFSGILVGCVFVLNKENKELRSLLNKEAE